MVNSTRSSFCSSPSIVVDKRYDRHLRGRSSREYNASVSHASVPGTILLQNRLICAACARGSSQSSACMRGGVQPTLSAAGDLGQVTNPSVTVPRRQTPPPPMLAECEGL